jgi:hypothetical protein
MYEKKLSSYQRHATVSVEIHRRHYDMKEWATLGQAQVKGPEVVYTYAASSERSTPLLPSPPPKEPPK